MTQQPSLFDAPILILGVPTGAKALTRAQRKFNNLVEKLKTQRYELSTWQKFRQNYQQEVADKYQPIVIKLRDKRLALMQLFDRAMDHKKLNKRERGKVKDILRHLIAQLLTDSPDPKIIELHDKYSDISYAEEQQHELKIMRSFASDTLGIDVSAYKGSETPAELAEWLKQQARRADSNSNVEHDSEESQERKKSTKTIERESRQQQAAEGGTRAVREVFRKLASELHPDRESDPMEQVRKTELMQRVNQAYKAGDLLALLELQLKLEQIDATALAGLAEERLRHYIHVLEDQSRQLRDELLEVIALFTISDSFAKPPKITPADIQRSFNLDIQELKGELREVGNEFDRYQDINFLKQSLTQYRVSD